MKTFPVYYIDHRKLEFSSPRELREKADALLLEKSLGISYEMLAKNQYGKPYLPADLKDSFLKKQDFSNPNFSHLGFSHAKDYSILALWSEEFGIDLEEAKDLSKLERLDSVARRSFIPDYLSKYEAITAKEERGKAFLQYWTATEAVLKAEGMGFHLDPRDNVKRFDQWILTHCDLKDHHICIATKEKIQIEFIELCP